MADDGMAFAKATWKTLLTVSAYIDYTSTHLRNDQLWSVYNTDWQKSVERCNEGH